MANITTSGTTSYPSAIDTRTALTDGAAGDLIVANHPNGLGAAVLAVEAALGTTPQGTAADVVTRLNISQNADGTLKSSQIVGGPGAAVSYSVGTFTVAFSGDGPQFLQNVGLKVIQNFPVANQISLFLQQADLSTPTTTNPCRIAFRNAATTSSGGYTIAQATQSTSMVITGGSTLGMVAGEIGRVYIGAVVSNSVPELCAWNPKTWFSTTVANHVLQLFRPSETEFQTTTAEGGAGAADSAATLFSTTARTSVPFRILGYMDIQQGAVAGNWSNGPFALNLAGPGVKLTGDVVQTFATVTSTQTSTTATCPADDTIPQFSEGIAGLIASMTATTQVNPINIRSMTHCANQSGAADLTAHLHLNAAANAVVAFTNRANGANDPITLSLECMLATNTGAATGYYLVVGGNAGVTLFNGGGSAGGATHLFGGVSVARMTIEEIAS